MRNRNKIAGALAATAVVASGLVAMTSTTANAAAVSGGCSSFFVDANTPIASTGGAGSGYLGDPNGAWSDEATTNVKPDYTLTSAGDTAVGGTRTFALTYDKGMKSFAPAAGTQYWYFSVNGTMLPPVTNPLSIGTAVAGGATINGSYTIGQSGANNIVFEKMVFDATAGVRVVCSGQTGNTPTDNPHATPIATNISTAFSATAVATATVTGISNQTSTSRARAGDVISFEASDFTGSTTATASLCTTAATPVCSGTTTVAIDGSGEGSGTLTIPGSAMAPGGARELVITSGDGFKSGKAPITLMGSPVLTANIAAGGAGTVVTLTGSNWDTGGAISINSYSGAGQTSTANGTAKSINADGTGTFSTTYTVQAAGTTSINAIHPYRMPPGNTATFVVPGSVPFAYSADACTAKVGLAATGSCEVLETVTLNVTAGDLKMAKAAGDVALSGITLNGTAQEATGALKQVTVRDERGGNLGWSLVGQFSGLNGPVAIPASALTWTPDCAAGTNSDDTVTDGPAANFGATPLALCQVTSANNGTDGTTGGTFTADADLELAVPANQAAGSYIGTLTLTLS